MNVVYSDTVCLSNCSYLPWNACRIDYEETSCGRPSNVIFYKAYQCVLDPTAIIRSIQPLTGALKCSTLFLDPWQLCTNEISSLDYLRTVSLDQFVGERGFSGADWS